MKTIAIAALAVALVQDPPAARTGGRVEWTKDPVAAEKRAKLEQRAILFYFTDGGLPSKALDAGAFSAREVSSAARRFLTVMLECPDEKAHEEWRSRLKVAAFPTITVLEPDGKTFSEITAREPAELVAELTKIARKYPGRDVMWESSLEAAIEKAKDDPKPVAIYLHVADDDLGDAQERIVKLAGQSRADKFIWVELSATKEDKDPLKLKYDYYALPAVAILDPRFTEPKWLTTFELSAKMKSKDMEDKLEKQLKRYKDTKIKK